MNVMIIDTVDVEFQLSFALSILFLNYIQMDIVIIGSVHIECE